MVHRTMLRISMTLRIQRMVLTCRLLPHGLSPVCPRCSATPSSPTTFVVVSIEVFWLGIPLILSSPVVPHRLRQHISRTISSSCPTIMYVRSTLMSCFLPVIRAATTEPPTPCPCSTSPSIQRNVAHTTSTPTSTAVATSPSPRTPGEV